MTKYKLINILQQLESLEWSSLRKYLLMHTRVESDNFQLFEILRQHISKLNTNENVLRLRTKHFPHMTSKSYTNMLSRVAVWTENWIIHEEIKKDEHTCKTILLKYYNRKGLYKEADNTALKAEKVILKEEAESLAKYRHLSNIYHTQYYSNNPIKYKSGKELLQKIIDTRLVEYGCQLAAYKIELLNWKEINSSTNDNSILNINRIIKEVPPNKLLQKLNSVSEILEDRKAEFLFILLNELKENKFKSGSETELLFASYLTSLSLKMWAENRIKNSDFILEIYEFGFNSGILLTHGKIPLVRWYNIVSVVSELTTKNRAEKFITDWIYKVSSPELTNSKILSFALLAFYNGEYHRSK